MSNDMSILEYARGHGLAFDHLNNDPTATFDQLQATSLEEPDFAETLSKEFSDYDESLLFERLSITKESAIFLATSITNVYSPEAPDPYQMYRCMKAMRLEPPLLPKDHGHSHPVQANDIRNELTSALTQNEGLRLGCDNDPEWSPEELKLSSEWTAAIESERIDSTREVLLAIQNNLKDEYSSQTEADIIQTELNYSKVRSLAERNKIH